MQQDYNRRMARSLLTLLMVFFAGTALGEEPKPSGVEAPLANKIKDSQSPWHVTCKTSLGLGKKDRRSVCRGNVKLWRDDLSVTCDTAELFHDDKWAVKRAVCVENVVLKSAEGKATAEKAEFDNITRWLVLTGNPVLYQGASEMRGKLIRFNLDSEEFEVQQLRGKSSPASQPTDKLPTRK